MLIVLIEPADMFLKAAFTHADLHKVSPRSEPTQCVALLCSWHSDHLSTGHLPLSIPANVVLCDDSIGVFWGHQRDSDGVSVGRGRQEGCRAFTGHWGEEIGNV